MPAGTIGTPANILTKVISASPESIAADYKAFLLTLAAATELHSVTDTRSKNDQEITLLIAYEPPAP